MVHSGVHCRPHPFGTLGHVYLVDCRGDSGVRPRDDPRRSATASRVRTSLREEGRAEREPDGADAVAGTRVIAADRVFGNPPFVWRISNGRHHAKGSPFRAVCARSVRDHHGDAVAATVLCVYRIAHKYRVGERSQMWMYCALIIFVATAGKLGGSTL